MFSLEDVFNAVLLKLYLYDLSIQSKQSLSLFLRDVCDILWVYFTTEANKWQHSKNLQENVFAANLNLLS